MKNAYLFIILSIFAGCLPDETSTDNIVRQIEDIGGSVIRDESENVIYINLSSCQIDDTLIHQLSGFDQLQYLHLEYSDIENDELQVIGRIASLEALNINSTNTTDEGLFFLQPLVNLKKLEMNHYILTRQLPEELKSANIQDVLNGKIEITKMGPGIGDGMQALIKRNPELQVEYFGALTWPGAAPEN